VIAVGIWLVSIGLADLVAGLSGEPKPGPRTIWGIISGAIAPFALSILCGASAGTVVLLTSITGFTGGGWLLLRQDAPRMSAIRALVALGVVLTSFLVVSALGTEPIMTFSGDPIVARAIHRLPFPVIAGASLPRVLFVAGVLTLLFATSNAIVRLVLTAMARGSPTPSNACAADG
jgi:hypothetical protein